MNLMREKRVEEEDEARERLDLIYKEKIKKAEQEKLTQLEISTKLEEEEGKLEVSQEHEKNNSS